MTVDHKGLVITCLVLRVVTVATLVVSIYLITTNKFRYSFQPEPEVTFDGVIGYRYVLATSAIGLLYTLIQFPVTIFLLLTQRNTNAVVRLLDFSLYGDKVISFLLATGVGAGYLVSVDLRGLIHELVGDNIEVQEVGSKTDDFETRAIISTSFLLVGAIGVMTTSIIFSVIRTSAKKGFFG